MRLSGGVALAVSAAGPKSSRSGNALTILRDDASGAQHRAALPAHLRRLPYTTVPLLAVCNLFCATPYDHEYPQHMHSSVNHAAAGAVAAVSCTSLLCILSCNWLCTCRQPLSAGGLPRCKPSCTQTTQPNQRLPTGDNSLPRRGGARALRCGDTAPTRGTCGGTIQELRRSRIQDSICVNIVVICVCGAQLDNPRTTRVI